VAAGTCLVLVSVAVAESPTVANPVLTGWISEVLLQNPEMQAAEAAVDAASGRYRAADRPLFNPELEFEYENSDSTTTAGGFNQAIDWADKRGARAEVADYVRTATQAELRAVRQRLAGDLNQVELDHGSPNTERIDGACCDGHARTFGTTPGA